MKNRASREKREKKNVLKSIEELKIEKNIKEKRINEENIILEKYSFNVNLYTELM